METVGGMPVLGTVDESGKLHFTPEGRRTLLGDDEETVNHDGDGAPSLPFYIGRADQVASGLERLAQVASDSIHTIDGIAVPMNVNASYYVAEARRKLLLAMLDLHSAARCQRND